MSYGTTTERDGRGKASGHNVRSKRWGAERQKEMFPLELESGDFGRPPVRIALYVQPSAAWLHSALKPTDFVGIKEQSGTLRQRNYPIPRFQRRPHNRPVLMFRSQRIAEFMFDPLIKIYVSRAFSSNRRYPIIYPG